MKIIDAHLHFSNNENFQRVGDACGQTNSWEFLEQEFKAHNIVKAIAMGTRKQEVNDSCFPLLPDLVGIPGTKDNNHPEMVSYCCGVDSSTIGSSATKKVLAEFERHLKSDLCVGIKIYTGYQKFYANDRIHYPFYELVQHYRKTVVFHTGDTAGGRGLLKYAHPLTVDDVAQEFPEANFVMAHFGNPWIVDATQVMVKNPNVFADLSGLVEGHFDVDEYVKTFHGYIGHLKTWMTYLADYDKFLFGTDWPLVGFAPYIELIKRLVPERHWNQVFYENAERVFFSR